MKPLVSVITPTANRPEMLKRCIEMFLAQDYENKEMVIMYSDVEWEFLLPSNVKQGYLENQTIGAKRNKAVEMASGEIIIHMDDDDFYSPQWITKSVEALQRTGHKGHKVALTGLNKAYFHNEAENKAWVWDNSRGQPYVCEATMAYWKETWQRFKFPHVNSGEGGTFIANAGYMMPHDNINDFIARIHGGNTASHKELHRMKPIDPKIVNGILNSGKISV